MTAMRTVTLAVVILAAGCATVGHGPLQRIQVDSEPAAAAVTRTNCGLKTQTVTAPAVIWVSRRATACTLTFTSKGYEAETVVLQREISNVTDANFFAVEIFETLPGVLFGVLAGGLATAVDAATGGMYELRPSRVLVELSRTAPP